MPQLIHDIAICIGVAWFLGVVAQTIRQPALLAYLVGGFALGPSCLNLVADPEAIEAVAGLGLIFLLFMIGLEIDLKKILSAGRSITVTAVVQIGGGFLLGLLVFGWAGMPMGRDGRWDGLYLAVATASSCTVIIVKLLYDQRELDTLAGRITLGVVVLQDLFAILFLAVQPNLNHLRPVVVLGSFLRVAALLVTALAVSRYLLPHIFRRVARLPELMLVGAIAWCFLVGELAARLGLSREMGALVAGVALSTFPYALDVTTKVTSLRDFFVTLFFVGLGLKIPVPSGAVVGLAAGVMAFTVTSRFITTFTPLYLMKTGLRISLLPALYLCQISEFSLVVLSLGLQAGQIGRDTGSAVSLAFVVLAVVSSMIITNGDPVVRRLMPWFQRWGLPDLGQDAAVAAEPAPASARILILGFFRTASSLLEEIRRHAPDLLPQLAVVDFNPVVYEGLRQQDVKVFYGDVSHPETLLRAGAAGADLFVCTVSDSLLKGTTNEKLVRHLRDLNPRARIIATADVLTEVSRLREAGADYVSIPRLGEAVDLREAIRAAAAGLLDQKQSAVDEQLKNRREILS